MWLKDNDCAFVFNLQSFMPLKACEYNKGLFQMLKYKEKVLIFKGIF